MNLAKKMYRDTTTSGAGRPLSGDLHHSRSNPFADVNATPEKAYMNQYQRKAGRLNERRERDEHEV